jgi:glycosyltransferase involved in cell wall biosynthesis
MKIAILTDLPRWIDAYSLCHVIRAQTAMLKRYGHEFTVFVGGESWGEICPFQGPLECLVPKFSGTSFTSVEDLDNDEYMAAHELADRLAETLQEFDVVFTHDWIFSSKKAPLAEALRLCADRTRALPFFHWVHSVPTGDFDWWDLNRYGPNHRIVYPNATDAAKVAQVFKTSPRDVIAIPHVVDLRLLFNFSERVQEIINLMPGLMQGDFVQVYPAAADRLSYKGLDHLIRVFGELAQFGTVALLVVDSWSGGGKQREGLQRYKDMAFDSCLGGGEFSFASDLTTDQEFYSLPHRDLMSLMQCSNVFCFPTLGEAFGLGVVESCLAGATLPVLNSSWSQSREIIDTEWGLPKAFPSAERGKENIKPDYPEIARSIASVTHQDESWLARKFCRQTYNMDAIYRNHYEPLFKWCEGYRKSA